MRSPSSAHASSSHYTLSLHDALPIYQPARLATNSAETEQRQASIDQVRAIQSLGSMPLTVLTSTKLASFYSDPLPDRKSTRLNSSHPSMSYAVFCFEYNTPTALAILA